MGIVKKMYNKVRKAAKKRYVAKAGGRKSTGGLRVMKMAKDIMYLKSVLNPEKKRTVTNYSTVVGQVNANDDGALFLECVPTITQGITSNTRNGASVKLHSSVWHFQFAQQSNAISKMKLILEIWAIEKEPYTQKKFFTEHWNPNPFVGTGVECRDYNAQINPDNFMKGKCIARRKITLAADSVTSDKPIYDLKLPVLYNKGKGRHLRYNNNTDDLEVGQMYLVIRADRGNFSTTTISTLGGIPEAAINTGATVQYNRVDYFYDN